MLRSIRSESQTQSHLLQPVHTNNNNYENNDKDIAQNNLKHSRIHTTAIMIKAQRNRSIYGSKNSSPNPKRPVNMLDGTDPDPYFISKWDPNPCRPEKCLKCTTRTWCKPDHYSKVGPEPGWEDTDPTAPVPIGTYCTANAIKAINKLRKKKVLP